MKDTYARPIDYLRLSVTDRCNYRCQYCMPAEGITKLAHSDLLTLEEMAEVVAAAASLGIRKVRITGGEPLVRLGLPSLVAAISHTKGIEEVAMTTNGSLLSAFAEELKAAGLDRVNISLDTLQPEKFARMTRLGTLSDVFDGIRAAFAAGLTPLKLNVVLMGGFNDEEIPALAELSRRYPLEVRFIELMPMLGASGFGREAYLPCRTVLDRLPALLPDKESGVAQLYRFPDGVGRVGLISPLSHHFCSRCNKLRLTADGHLKPCLHSQEEISVRGLHGDDLIAALQTAITHKPREHGALSWTEPSEAGRRMNEIGG